MSKPFLLIYGVLCYALFNICFLYMAGFVLDLFVPKSVNDGPVTHPGLAIAINLGLVFLFGFFHSLMARQSFKDLWTKFVPAEAERSTFVLQSSLFLALAMWQWRPLETVIWSVSGPAVWFFYAIFVLGLAFVLISTFLIDYFELFGLRQIWFAQSGKPLPRPVFRTPFLYKMVRHPMQLGLMLALFAAPVMTLGHFIFAFAMTVYILIGLHFEERSLVREFGDRYQQYQATVPMLIPQLPGVPSKRTA